MAFHTTQRYDKFFMGKPSQNYRVSHNFYLQPNISEHTPALIRASKAGNWFTYPGGMEGWVDLGDLMAGNQTYDKLNESLKC